MGKKDEETDGMRLKAVLFDMDGVLFDSMKNHTLAWYRTIAGEGVSCERDEFYLYEGATGRWTIDRIFERAYGRKATDGEIGRIYEEKNRRFNELPPVEVMPGAREVLEKVRSKGLIPVVVTGSGQRSLLERLEREFPGVFAAERVVTAFDVRHGKPHPEPYLKGLEKAGVKAGEAVVVENAPLGVRAAVAAGIFTAAVNTGPIPPRKLREAGAGLVFSGMSELADSFDDLVRLWSDGK